MRAIEQGEEFGLLVALEPRKIGCYKAFLCLCKCGTKKVIRSSSLIAGFTKSCGCLRRKVIAERSYKHGHAIRGKLSSEHAIWHAMIQRCYSPKCVAFKNYGGRGITVCNEWREDFRNFLADMGLRPGNLTLDRIDNNGNYTPKNCRWASWETQNKNKRLTKH